MRDDIRTKPLSELVTILNSDAENKLANLELLYPKKYAGVKYHYGNISFDGKIEANGERTLHIEFEVDSVPDKMSVQEVETDLEFQQIVSDLVIRFFEEQYGTK